MSTQKSELVSDTATLVQQMREALDAMAAEMTVGERYTNAGQWTLDAIAAADEWLSRQPKNQCGETCERAKLCAVCARGLEEQQPVKRLTDEQTNEIEDWFSNEFGLEAKHRTDFARAIETACAAAWGVNLEEPT